VLAPDAMRVLVVDRGVLNPYSVGLVRGLRSLNVSSELAGPSGSQHEGIHPVFPRYGVRGQRFRKAAEAPAGLARFLGVLIRYRPQVVHFQWATRMDLVYFYLVSRLSNAAIAFTVHNPAPRSEAERQRTAIAQAQVVFVHGETMRDQLLELYPDAEGRVVIAQHGGYEPFAIRYDRSDARSQLGLSDDAIVYAFVGSIARRKGILTLLDAFSQVLQRHSGSPVHLLLAGYAQDDSADAVVAAAAVEPRITSLVGVSHVAAETIDLVLSAADQVVLPFEDASQSGSAIYAMTHGRCVVSTACGELPGLLENRGFIVAPGDSVALAHAMEVAIVDAARCRELGRLAQDYARNDLDWSVVARAFVDGYKQALTRPQ
jgi:glycosyltransferase involved in cell wall biosynthesis